MEAKNEVVHVTDELSTKFKVASVIRAFSGGPTLFFETVEGYDTKIVGNVCAIHSRICSALDVAPGQT
ncbi:MAG: UbiD family decarboxylase [Candidatus Bathyarchaeota archaeon]|nr:UbiD family decarboxylase [Candidatus Bathyarchaeota archaeon]